MQFNTTNLNKFPIIILSCKISLYMFSIKFNCLKYLSHRNISGQSPISDLYHFVVIKATR